MACENLKETTGMQMPGARDDQLKSQLDQPKEKKVKTVRESKIFKSSLVYWGTGKIAPAQPREDACPETPEDVLPGLISEGYSLHVASLQPWESWLFLQMLNFQKKITRLLNILTLLLFWYGETNRSGDDCKKNK